MMAGSLKKTVVGYIDVKQQETYENEVDIVSYTDILLMLLLLIIIMMTILLLVLSLLLLLIKVTIISKRVNINIQCKI